MPIGWTTYSDSGTAVSTDAITTSGYNLSYRSNNTAWNTWTTSTIITSATWTTWSYWTYDGTYQAPEGGIHYAPLGSPAAARAADAVVRQMDEAEQQRLEAHRNRIDEAWAEARRQAEALLLGVLDPVQQAEYAKAKQFHVVSRSGTRYRVTQGAAGNVYRLEGERLVEKLCIHQGAEHKLPVADTMAAQKLLLDADEDAFLRIANRTPLAA